jgi:hypothetical protein
MSSAADTGLTHAMFKTLTEAHPSTSRNRGTQHVPGAAGPARRRRPIADVRDRHTPLSLPSSYKSA